MSVPPAYPLSPSDASEYLGAHEDTVKRWARDGKLKGIRTPGGWWKFRQADLDEFLADAANVTAPETAA